MRLHFLKVFFLFCFIWIVCSGTDLEETMSGPDPLNYMEKQNFYGKNKKYIYFLLINL